jgi:hypothetical protein
VARFGQQDDQGGRLGRGHDPQGAHADHTPVVEPGRTIIRTTTIAQSTLNMPVVIASRLAAARVPPSTGASSAGASRRRWPGRMTSARRAAAIAVSAIDVMSQASARTPSCAPVASPKAGTTTPTTA